MRTHAPHRTHARPHAHAAPPHARAGRMVARAMPTKKEEQTEASNSGLRQMLGMKGAGAETDVWKIRVQLTKPVTWIPLIWGAWQ